MTHPKAPDEWFNQRIIEGNGIFDRDSYELMMSAVKSFRTAIDIGAHVGTWSIPMASHFKQVMSFEPDWVNFKYLLANTSGINNIIKHNIALGAANEWVGMEKGSENSGQSFISTNTKNLSQPILMAALDDYDLSGVDLIKIDTEGFELNVLRGAAFTIAKCSPVIMVELNGLGKRYGIMDSQVKEFLESLSYKLFGKQNKDYVYVRKYDGQTYPLS